MLREIGRTIHAATNILVVTHLAPDGDALGSLTAVGGWLQREGKTVTMAVDGGMSRRFDFLPLAGEVRDKSADGYDLLVALDCGDAGRMGEVFASLKTRPLIINIDHHATNPNFGDLNWVDPSAASTAEMLYFLLHEIKIPLDLAIATSLLTGIVTDTQSFSTSNVTSRSLIAAAGLMEAGANLSQITEQAFSIKPHAAMRLWGIGLSNALVEDGLAWVKLSARDKQRAGYDGTGSAGLVTQLVNIQEAAMSAVLVEQDDGRISVSLRSRLPFRVSDVAVAFGGGGHPQAAGCQLDMPLEKAELVIVDACKYALLEQKDALKA
jgi:phosphoesterase RecJ-like protein